MTIPHLPLPEGAAFTASRSKPLYTHAPQGAQDVPVQAEAAAVQQLPLGRALTEDDLWQQYLLANGEAWD